jgi:hypothetical protein
VLQPIQNFLAAVADDFREPHAAVHGHEQRAFPHPHRLGVGDDVRVNQRIPHLDDLGLGAALVHVQVLRHARQHVADGAGAHGPRGFERREVHAAPLREHAAAGGHFSRPQRRKVFERRLQAGKSIGGKTGESKLAGLGAGTNFQENPPRPRSRPRFIEVVFSRTKDDLSGRLCACQLLLCGAKYMGMETNWAAEQLQTIRTLMERSAVYRRALAPIMLFAGVVGILQRGAGIFFDIRTPCGFVLFWFGVAAIA